MKIKKKKQKERKREKKRKLERSDEEEYGVAVRREQTVEHESHWLATCNRPGRERV